MPDDRYEAEVFRRADGLFDWRLIASNGEQVCESSQGYTEANDAREAWERVEGAIYWAHEYGEDVLREAVADA